jgi:Xaa-Pro aminopeptidase
MSDRFTQAFFSNNRQALRKKLGGDMPIVITASGSLQRAADGAYPFSQDANFWYLSGLNYSDIVLVIDGDDEYIIAPKLSDYQNIFDGSMSAAELTKYSGVQTILPKRDGWKRLASRLTMTAAVATLLPNSPYIPIYGMFTNPARQRLLRQLKRISPKLAISDIRPSLAYLRSRKQAIELDAIQEAIDITNQSIDIVAANIGNYRYEYEIEAAITGNILHHGAIDAWKPTVGAGANSCILHSSNNRAKLHAGDVVVIDIGAQVEHYCADITRTLALSGSFSARQQAVYNAVAAVQTYGFSLQRPGTFVRDNEKLVETFMGEQLQQLGLIKQADRSAIRHYFPHATSHFLGLDPHDAGNYAEPLESGMVLTVEPGIYIAEEDIGVRIEDDILVTESGAQLLSRK